MVNAPQQRGCALCGIADHLSFHHLIPRRVHQKAWVRKRFTREQRLRQGLWLCGLCHRFLHRQFDEQTLAREYDCLDRLLADASVQRHVAWAARQKRVAGPIKRR